MTLLDISGLTAGYGAGDVLHDVALTVEVGEIVVVLGANGAGKTTLMRSISGLIARRGSIDFDGVDIARDAPDAIVRRGLAMVPQGRGTISELSVEENLRAGAHTRKDRAGVIEDLDRWFTTFPRLQERKTQKSGLLSGGEQQMLAISRALMSRPRLLLCDEPSLGLSPKLSQDMFAALAQINADLGTAILLVEQNAMSALKIASRGYLIEVGVVADSRPAEVLAGDDSIRAAYLGY